MTVHGSYANGFAPRDSQPLYPELWHGCVGAWAPCLGPTGLTLRDWSGRANHGTLTSMEVGTDWAINAGRYALDLATDDYVVCPSLAVSGNVWTMSIWGMYRSTTTSQAFWSQYTSGTSGRSFLVINYNKSTGAVSANELAFGTVDVLSNAIGTGAATLATNTWYHLVVRATGAEISMWVNGVQIATSAYSISIQSAAMTFGRLGNLTTFYLDGLIDDARAYNYAISDSQIRHLASHRGIAYELAPRRRGRIFTGGGFKAYWAARKAQIIGGGL